MSSASARSRSSTSTTPATPPATSPPRSSWSSRTRSSRIIAESNAGDASGEYLHDQKIPVVGWQLGLPVYGTYPNYFGMQNANTKDIKTDFTSRNSDVIKALGGKKLAIVGSNAGEQRRCSPSR